MSGCCPYGGVFRRRRCTNSVSLRPVPSTPAEYTDLHLLTVAVTAPWDLLDMGFERHRAEEGDKEDDGEAEGREKRADTFHALEQRCAHESAE
eukprot:5028727-Prymnesium_polylepis.4